VFETSSDRVFSGQELADESFVHNGDATPTSTVVLIEHAASDKTRVRGPEIVDGNAVPRREGNIRSARNRLAFN
jgi:hypothetical protein